MYLPQFDEEECSALHTAIAALEEQKKSINNTRNVLENIYNELDTIMEGDTRTLKNPETEDGKYYEGIYKAITIVNEYYKKELEK